MPFFVNLRDEIHNSVKRLPILNLLTSESESSESSIPLGPTLAVFQQQMIESATLMLLTSHFAIRYFL
jgi:hypothetical protein